MNPDDLQRWTEDWPAQRVALAVVTDESTTATGDGSATFALASVTKLLTAWALLVAVEEETIELDEEVTDAGATVADLASHASGLGPEGDQLTEPRTRRIYSNAGYELLADLVAERAAMPFATYLHDAVVAPLAMTRTELDGSPAHGASSCLDDLVAFARELLAPKLLAAETVRSATRAHLPDLAGVLPGFGRQEPNPWGLGPELRGSKTPHWTGGRNSEATWGHFGQAGTFVWVDPDAAVACVCLTDEPFGPWAQEAWPTVSDAVLGALA